MSFTSQMFVEGSKISLLAWCTTIWAWCPSVVALQLMAPFCSWWWQSLEVCLGPGTSWNQWLHCAVRFIGNSSGTAIGSIHGGNRIHVVYPKTRLSFYDGMGKNAGCRDARDLSMPRVDGRWSHGGYGPKGNAQCVMEVGVLRTTICMIHDNMMICIIYHHPR